MRRYERTPPVIAVLPRAPQNGSPVPGLTSLYHNAYAGPYGNRAYPGNCGGEIIKDLLRYFQPQRVLDPMSGSGTCLDVCRDLRIVCVSFDISNGTDACDPATYERFGSFDFIWAHPPYWRQKTYTEDSRDLSNATSLAAFLVGYSRFIRNCERRLAPGGRLAILMGDYSDRTEGFVPLVYHTKRLCFEVGLRQCCTDIIRFSHGASSSSKVYRSSFIPGLHDVVTIVEKPE
jgi:SAM-dependent methyltransferase